MFYSYYVSHNERAVVLHDGVPVLAVGPGRYRYFSKRELRHFNTDEALFEASPEIRAALPSAWYETFEIGEDERAVLFRNGVPSAFLKPGTYWCWAFDKSLRVQRFDVQSPLSDLTEGLLKVIPSSAIVSHVVTEHQRSVLYAAGSIERVLEPGLHTFWTRANTPLTFSTFNTDDPLFAASSEVRAALPSAWYEAFEIGEDERGVLFQNGTPSVYLKPGMYWRWTFDETLKVQRFDARLPLSKPTQGLMSVVPSSAVAFQVVAEYERALLYVAGSMEQVLKPGLYAFWTRADAPIAITKVDLRLQQLTITGQDLMTRDKVTLRLTLSAEYRVADPALMAQMTDSPRDAIYLKAQLAARDYVASVKLDELLEGRSVMTEFMEEALRPSAAAMGLELGRVGVKDVILPGDMKLLLNRVIEAEKEAAAQVILRREEVAATRSLANSAKLMAEFPGVMRLKELDALREMAASVGELKLLMVPGEMGLEGLTHLLSEKSK